MLSILLLLCWLLSINAFFEWFNQRMWSNQRIKLCDIKKKKKKNIAIFISYFLESILDDLRVFLVLSSQFYPLLIEAVVRRYSVKKMFLQISQNSQQKTCARCFPVSFAKFLGTPFFTEHLRWLLLYLFSKVPFFNVY